LPYIDGKRPYGDRSYYQIDMAEILGKPYARNAQGGTLPPQKDEALKQLHANPSRTADLLMHGTPRGPAAWRHEPGQGRGKVHLS
jgi:hypothetical protein